MRHYLSGLQPLLALACTCLLVGVAAPGGAGAQDVHEKILPTLVYLKVTALSDDPEPQEIAEAGTGFFINSQGYILTSYHLLKKFTKVKKGSFKVRLSIGAKKENPDEIADVVQALPAVDLAMLKMVVGAKPPEAVNLGSAFLLPSHWDRKVHTSGFVANRYPPTQVSDDVTQRQGPGGYTWLLNKTVEDGQSGSPVYLADSTVIGIMKGAIGQEIGAFVPIDLAAQLLLPFRNEARNEEWLHKVIDDQIKKYVQQKLVNDAAEAVVEIINQHVKTKDKDITAQLNDKFDKYRDGIVSNSYSASFYFPVATDAGAKEYRSLAFYKTNEDEAELKCKIIWPGNANNEIIVTVNNEQEVTKKQRPPRENSTILFHKFEKKNWKMFVDAKPDWPVSNYHQLTFMSVPALSNAPPTSASVARSPVAPAAARRQGAPVPVERQAGPAGPISVDCTLLIIGPTKYTVRNLPQVEALQ